MVENPRLELAIAKYGRQLAIALIVVAALSFAVGGWMATDTTTEVVTQQTNQQQVRTNATDRAVVVHESAPVVANNSSVGTANNSSAGAANDSATGTTNNSSTGATNDSAVETSEETYLWEEGTVLRDQPVYLFSETPDLTVEATTAVEGADEATVTHQWVLAVEARRGNETFWSNRTVIAVEQGSGSSVSSSTTIDMRTLRERVANTSDRIGTAGVVNARLQLVVTYETGRYEGSKTRSVGIDIGQNAYVVGDGLGWEQPHSTPVQTEVEQPREGSMPLILILLGLITSVLAAAISFQDPGEIDPERVRNRIHRRQYAHWISPGRLPFDIDQPYVELESLEDLVDVAIDTQERVVYDRDRDLFAVIAENALYYHSVDSDWTGTVFPEITQPSDGAGFDGGGDGDGGEFPGGPAEEPPDGDEFGFGEFLPGSGDGEDPEE
jgi:hypothetical protein